MFNVGNVRVPVCHGATRRSFLQVGTAGLVGLSLPAMMSLDAQGAITGSGKIKNCITIFLVGSPGQLDTWDMKPDAPSSYRGPYQPISTKVPGMRINEMHTELAKVTDHFTLINSMSRKYIVRMGSGQLLVVARHIRELG